MRICSSILLLIVISSIIAGCGGSPATPVNDENAVKPVIDFIFAESPFMNIDSDMMAEQFFIDRLPVAVTRIDSATAVNAVYQILMDTILAGQADTFNLANVPSLYGQYQDLRDQKLVQALYDDEILPRGEVSDSMVQAWYDEHIEEFKIPAQYRARHIVISGHGFRKSADSTFYADKSVEELDSIALEKMEDLRSRAVAGASFDTLAMMYSQDPGTRDAGGDLGYFNLSQMPVPFDSAVTNTPMNEVSGVFKTLFGYHILRVEDFVDEHYLPLDSVSGKLMQNLMEDKLKAESRIYIDSLLAAGSLDFDSTMIMLADSLHSPDDVMATVNAADTINGNDNISYKEYAKMKYSLMKNMGTQRQLTYEERCNLLRGISIKYLVLRVARQLGYPERLDLADYANGIRTRYAVSTMRKKIIDENYDPPEEDVRAYYDAHIDDYQVERPIYVQHIIFADSNKAEYVRDLAMSGYDFLDLADEYYPGEADIRRTAADLGFIGPNDMPPEFWRAARATQIGQISLPVKTEFGYHLIKVVKKNYSVTYEKARLKIRPMLKKQHQENARREFVEGYLGKAPTIHLDLLSKLYRKDIPEPDFSQQYH